MSNVLRDNCTYFEVPQHLVSTGMLAALNGSDLRLYLALLFEAQRTTRTEIPLSGQQLFGITGLSAGAATDARQRLIARGLVAAKRGLGNAYRYTLLNLSSGEPMVNHRREASTNGTPRAGGASWMFNLTPKQYELYYRARLSGSAITTDKNGLVATCPFHEDSKPSLSISVQRGFWRCGGCGKGGGMILFEQLIMEVDEAEAIKNIAEIVGVNLADVGQYRQLEEAYDYRDEDGELLYQVLRFDPKDFGVRRPDPITGEWLPDLGDTRKVLYRLPDVLNAAHVIVVEGEKDSDRLNALLDGTCGASEVVATTNPFGAGKWLEQYNECLEGKDVIVIPDSDKSGLKHAEDVCRKLQGVAATARQVNLPSETGVKDMSDYLKGHSLYDVAELLDIKEFIYIEA